jgi:RNA polymerase sigma-70 factor (ECF subfamily)
VSQTVKEPRNARRSDAELLRLTLEDRESRAARQAASELFGRYREPVYQWCFRRVRNHDQALDLAQDVLLSAYRSLDAFDGRARFSSWLFAIARNRCLNALRRPSLFEERDPDSLADEQRGQDRELEEREEEEAVLRLIREHLDPLDQEVVWLRCFERMPVDAITTVLKIPGATGARGALQRARRKLRAALADRELRKGVA